MKTAVYNGRFENIICVYIGKPMYFAQKGGNMVRPGLRQNDKGHITNLIEPVLDNNGELTVSQSNLIKNIAKIEDMDEVTVRRVIKSAEDVVFAYLSSIDPKKKLNIKIFSGFSMSRFYKPAKDYKRGLFNITCDERVDIISSITRHYKKNVNTVLFQK